METLEESSSDEKDQTDELRPAAKLGRLRMRSIGCTHRNKLSNDLSMRIFAWQVVMPQRILLLIWKKVFVFPKKDARL